MLSVFVLKISTLFKGQSHLYLSCFRIQWWHFTKCKILVQLVFFTPSFERILEAIFTFSSHYLYTFSCNLILDTNCFKIHFPSGTRIFFLGVTKSLFYHIKYIYSCAYTHIPHILHTYTYTYTCTHTHAFTWGRS